MIIHLPTTQTRYINLPAYKNRNQTMINMLDMHGFKKYERVDGVLDDNFHTGHSRAHRNALNCEGTILILEDDCYPYDYRETIEVPDDADIVYLGMSAYGFDGVMINEDIYKINHIYSAHAILYLTEEGKDLARDAVNHLYMFDEYMYRNVGKANTYALTSPIWYQHDVPEQTAYRLDAIPENVKRFGGSNPDYPAAFFGGIK